MGSSSAWPCALPVARKPRSSTAADAPPIDTVRTRPPSSRRSRTRCGPASMITATVDSALAASEKGPARGGAFCRSLRRCSLHRDHGDDHVRDRVYDDEFVIVDEAQVTARLSAVPSGSGPTPSVLKALETGLCMKSRAMPNQRPRRIITIMARTKLRIMQIQNQRRNPVNASLLRSARSPASTALLGRWRPGTAAQLS